MILTYTVFTIKISNAPKVAIHTDCQVNVKRKVDFVIIPPFITSNHLSEVNESQRFLYALCMLNLKLYLTLINQINLSCYFNVKE